jgi:hypothetical protein
MDSGKELSYRERWGVAATVQAALLSRLRRWIGLRIYGIYSHPLVRPTGADPVVPGFSARLFQQGEADALIACAKSPNLDLSEAFVRDAIGKGDVCLAILCDNAIVSYSWCAFTPTHDDEGVFVRFGATYRYSYKSFTLPEYRGRHFLRIFNPIRDRYCMTARGCTRSIAFLGMDNRSSIRVALALGHRRIGTSGYLKCGPIFWPFSTAAAREHGFHFFIPAKGAR